MRSCGPHPSFSHSAFNAAAVSASMPSFRQRAGYQRVELSLCALARGVGACRLHSDGRSCRCGRNCLRRLLYGARLWPRCRNVITRYNTFASVICKVQWTLRSLSEGGVSCGKTTIKNLDKLQITCAGSYGIRTDEIWTIKTICFSKTACASAYKYRPNKLHKFLPWENAPFTGGWLEKTIVIFGEE